MGLFLCLSATADLSSWLFVYNIGSGFFVFVGLFLRLSTTGVMFLCLSATVGMFLSRSTTVGPVFVSVNSSGSDFVSVYKSGPVFVSVYNSRIVFVAICLQRRVCFNPFTAPACKISGLKDARTCLQTQYFPVL